MHIEHVRRLVARQVPLIVYDLARIVLVDVEAVVSRVDGYFAHFGGHAAVRQAREDAPRAEPEGYDVAKNRERGEGFVYNGRVTLSDAFYACGEATEVCGKRVVS